MNIIFFGNTKYSKIGLEIINRVYPISAVVTKPLQFSPVKQIAEQLNIQILETDKLDAEVAEQIKKLTPDFFVVEDYGLFVPEEILKLPRYTALNIHHSLLPKYRGPSPVPTAILNGDKVSGVTVIKMNNELDAGDIMIEQEYALAENETTDSLLTKLNQLGAENLIKVIEKYLNGNITGVKQDPSKATFTKRMQKEDGYFEIDNPPSPEILDRMIRAYYPWPGVWTKWSPSRHPEVQPKDLKIVKFLPGGLIQMEGKKAVSKKDFLNGYPNFPIKS